MSFGKFFRQQIKKPLKKYFNAGGKQECPICGYRGKKWKKMGRDNEAIRKFNLIGAGRRRGGCYNCGSNERERHIFIYLEEEVELFEKSEEYSILHIAPEKALSEKLLGLNLKSYQCGDLFTDGYTYPSQVQDMNVLNLPFEENTFDLVICNHVLEHIIEDRRAMKEIYRVLKPEATAILQVPYTETLQYSYEDYSIKDPAKREAHFGQFDHVRVYGLDYFDRVEQTGFQIQRLNLQSQFPKAGFNPIEDLILCKKKTVT
jgi:predicted SAM-dependent methyltransferase